MVWICGRNFSLHGKKTLILIPLWMPSAFLTFWAEKTGTELRPKLEGNTELGQTLGKVLRCKQVPRKGKQGQWPKCSEELVPSRGFALPGPWQWDNRGSGHLMAWSCLLSWPHLPWIRASAHHGKMNTQNSPQFSIIPCSLAMPGFQHWCNWKSLSPAQCSDSERLNRATLHRNVHNEVQRWDRSNPSLTGKWAHKIN